MIDPGQLVILSGPSGVGKDTVLDLWHQRNPRVSRVVAYTTREPRTGERNGIDYHFVDRDRFEELAGAGDFLEYKEVYGNLYATPLRDVERLILAGKIAVLKIDVQGAITAMSRRPDAISVFLLPPNDTELERRIRARNLDEPAVIEKRLATARIEIEQAGRYSYRIVNDHVMGVVDELERIVRSSTR